MKDVSKEVAAATIKRLEKALQEVKDKEAKSDAYLREIKAKYEKAIEEDKYLFGQRVELEAQLQAAYDSQEENVGSADIK